ncbi:hypothetical protein JNUCC0626_26780 [Lentzea sp. JNUCC 0626]|uniref:hypothetical protein n=1 Tax=Lentzea sp. JNUCC 0626 TaxID=3367513 RepID=UPI003749F9B5
MDPLPGLVLTFDVRSFSGQRNETMLSTRETLYRIVAESFDHGGVRWEDCAHEDRGDGILVVVPASVPKTTVLGSVLTELVHRISNAPVNADGTGLEVRIAAHGGEIHRDAKGFAGSDVILPFRLLDSRELRDALAGSTARCVVMVSDSLYESTVRHDYPGMAGRAFHPVEVRVKETSVRAWLHVPGAATPAPAAPPPVSPEPAVAQHNGARISAGGDIKVENGVLAGRDVITTESHRDPRWLRREDNQ